MTALAQVHHFEISGDCNGEQMNEVVAAVDDAATVWGAHGVIGSMHFDAIHYCPVADLVEALHAAGVQGYITVSHKATAPEVVTG